MCDDSLVHPARVESSRVGEGHGDAPHTLMAVLLAIKPVDGRRGLEEHHSKNLALCTTWPYAQAQYGTARVKGQMHIHNKHKDRSRAKRSQKGISTRASPKGEHAHDRAEQTRIERKRAMRIVQLKSSFQKKLSSQKIH